MDAAACKDLRQAGNSFWPRPGMLDMASELRLMESCLPDAAHVK